MSAKPITAGFSLSLYTSVEEIRMAKSGDNSFMVAFTQPTEDYHVQIGVTADACEFTTTEVRINIEKVALSVEKVGQLMAQAMVGEMEKAFKGMFGE